MNNIQGPGIYPNVGVNANVNLAGPQGDLFNIPPEVPNPGDIAGRIKNAQNADLKYLGISSYGMAIGGGIVSGAAAAASIIGMIATPVGWGIAGVGLTFALAHGHSKEFIIP